MKFWEVKIFLGVENIGVVEADGDRYGVLMKRLQILHE